MAQQYNPFARGPHPVGVCTESWADTTRDRVYDVEIWYPATAGYAGADLDAATRDSFGAVWLTNEMDDSGDVPQQHQDAVRDAAPLNLPGPFVLFSHGFAGHRREATFICTHLASHGYVVGSADHIGSTSWDVDDSLDLETPPDREDDRLAMGADRKADVPFLVGEATERGYASAGPIGVTGISLGGWTTMISPAVEPRVAAIAPMCPAGGRSPVAPVENGLRDEMDLDWSDKVSCLQMVADRDSWLPLYGQMEMFDKLPGPAQMVILRDADHNHFVDDIATSHTWYREFTWELAKAYPDGEANWAAIAQSIAPLEELVDPDVASTLWRGLTVAHFDACLRQNLEAADLLDNRIRVEAARLGASVLTIKEHQ